MKFRKYRNGWGHSNVASMTDELGHEGSPEGDVGMKKSLLATVAAIALIAGTGFASAEGVKEQPGMNAAPAIKKTKRNFLPMLPPPVLTGSGSMGSRVSVVTRPASQALKATPA